MHVAQIIYGVSHAPHEPLLPLRAREIQIAVGNPSLYFWIEIVSPLNNYGRLRVHWARCTDDEHGTDEGCGGHAANFPRVHFIFSLVVGSPTEEEDGLSRTAMPGQFGRYSQDLVETARDALKCVCGAGQLPQHARFGSMQALALAYF